MGKGEAAGRRAWMEKDGGLVEADVATSLAVPPEPAARQPAAAQPAADADRPECRLETDRRREPDAAHPRAAHRVDRPALLRAVDDRPAAPGLVRARALRPGALPAVRALQLSARCWRCSPIPLAVEPLFPTRWQSWLWSGLFACFVVACGLLAWRGRNGKPMAAQHHQEGTAADLDRTSCCGRHWRPARRS
jgi:hypothetical protein